MYFFEISKASRQRSGWGTCIEGDERRNAGGKNKSHDMAYAEGLSKIPGIRTVKIFQWTAER
jgi:hypothetical protein